MGKLALRWGAGLGGPAPRQLLVPAVRSAWATPSQERMMRGILLWLIGIPIPIILLLWLLGVLH